VRVELDNAFDNIISQQSCNSFVLERWKSHGTTKDKKRDEGGHTLSGKVAG
jgi:hypothetical protein